jgi:hypothetical protein
MSLATTNPERWTCVPEVHKAYILATIHIRP